MALNERVIRINNNNTWWSVTSNKRSYQAKTVILTTGGKSYPQLGSTGDGYEIAQKLGHRIIEPKPALVPLILADPMYKNIAGIKHIVILKLIESKKIIIQKLGELLFTHTGISGPVVLDISRLINLKSIVTVNFISGFNNENDLMLFLKRQSRQTLLNALSKIMPRRLIRLLLSKMVINADKQVSHISKAEVKVLYNQLGNWQLDIKSAASFQESMVTAGGVALDSVNPKTMQSKLHKGLYFAGEILDIDGISGGYNLQFAWSSGYIAGKSCNT
ncbi:MAG: aminoacetone oxidase family FAD-binding enzyme [candidate division WOR-3 bacterium]|nr:aminoacetone oxidase family FAD-binding enzyme [candidate division WOR-3 bacterium]